MIDYSIDTSYGSLSNELKLILQQIDILFDTNPTQVLGQEDFGTQYDRYLHELKISNDALASVVESDLNSLELFGFTPTVEVYLIEGTIDDIALVNITLRQDDIKYEKTYKIS